MFTVKYFHEQEWKLQAALDNEYSHFLLYLCPESSDHCPELTTMYMYSCAESKSKSLKGSPSIRILINASKIDVFIRFLISV